MTVKYLADLGNTLVRYCKILKLKKIKFQKKL